MKKITALVLVLVMALSLFACGNTKKEKTVDIMEGEKVVGKSYYENDELVKEEYTNENGDIATFKEYTDGKLSQTGKNTYGEDGSLTEVSVSTLTDDRVTKEEHTFYEKGKASRVSTVDYTYNDDGSVLESVSNDGVKSSEVLKDSAGEKVYTAKFDEKGSVKETYENGDIAKSESFDTDGKLVGYSDMEYDENGLSTGSKTYNAAGELILTSVYEYKDGKMAKILMYDADGELYQTGIYDEDGKLTICDKDGNPVNK